MKPLKGLRLALLQLFQGDMTIRDKLLGRFEGLAGTAILFPPDMALSPSMHAAEIQLPVAGPQHTQAATHSMVASVKEAIQVT